MKQKKEKCLKHQGAFVVLGVMIIVLAIVFALSRQIKTADTVDMSQQEDVSVSDMNRESVNVESIEYVELFEIEVQNKDTGVCKAVGTGVVYQVAEDGVWIATAAHVLNNKSDDDRIVLNCVNVSIECTTWLRTQGADLAYLYLPQEAIAAGMVMVPVETDKPSYDMLTTGDVVLASGYCEGKLADYVGVLIENWIYVEDFAQYMIVVECEVKHGMSGGGLYDVNGKFIGMICGGNEEGELVAMPWHVMQARFEEICKE